MVEYSAFNRKVLGSSPRQPNLTEKFLILTIFKNGLLNKLFPNIGKLGKN